MRQTLGLDLMLLCIYIVASGSKYEYCYTIFSSPRERLDYHLKAHSLIYMYLCDVIFGTLSYMDSQ